MFNNEYIVKFNNKYKFDNFNIEKKLYFILGEPIKTTINIKKICAMCNLDKDDIGIIIKDFNILNTKNGEKLIKHIEKRDFFSINRNIIKKSDNYSMTICFLTIKKLTKEEQSIISKKNKIDKIFEILI